MSLSIDFVEGEVEVRKESARRIRRWVRLLRPFLDSINDRANLLVRPVPNLNAPDKGRRFGRTRLRCERLRALGSQHSLRQYVINFASREFLGRPLKVNLRTLHVLNRQPRKLREGLLFRVVDFVSDPVGIEIILDRLDIGRNLYVLRLDEVDDEHPIDGKLYLLL